MPTHSKFQEKMDVLDILISILREHEETLSRLVERFDAIYNNLSDFEEKASILDRSLERLDGLRVKNVVGSVGLKGPLVTVKCKDWLTFRSASQGALLVAFEVAEDQIMFYSVSDLFVFIYSERFPKVETLIDEKVRKWLKRYSKDGESVYETILSPKSVKRWLSSELGVPEEKVVEGRVLQ